MLINKGSCAQQQNSRSPARQPSNPPSDRRSKRPSEQATDRPDPTPAESHQQARLAPEASPSIQSGPTTGNTMESRPKIYRPLSLRVQYDSLKSRPGLIRFEYFISFSDCNASRKPAFGAGNQSTQLIRRIRNRPTAVRIRCDRRASRSRCDCLIILLVFLYSPSRDETCRPVCSQKVWKNSIGFRCHRSW